MTPEELTRLRELERAATASPWSTDDHVVRPGDSPGQWHIYESGEDDPPLFSSGLGTKEDAAFIAAARNALPGLLDELERLWKLAEERTRDQ